MVRADNAQRHGAFGPFGPRMCEQLWMLPSASAEIDLRATVFRPGSSAADCSADVPRPLVVINHGTDAGTREAIAMPVFYWLSRWFVDRGYVVVLPQRRGHGATAGDLAEGQDSCARPDHYAAGQTAADDIETAVKFMSRQSFVDARTILAVGISSGGWASLALSGRDIPGLRGVVNFAGGRGAYAGGRATAVCGVENLYDAARRLGQQARVPSLWLYASNDTFFNPTVARRLADAFIGSGGPGELHVLPPYGREGHFLADDRAGWQHWSRQLTAFLARSTGEDGSAAIASRADAPRPLETAGSLGSTPGDGRR